VTLPKSLPVPNGTVPTATRSTGISALRISSMAHITVPSPPATMHRTGSAPGGAAATSRLRCAMPFFVGSWMG